jgi:hypothetical protein
MPITTIGNVLKGWDDERCWDCPASLACITDAFSTVHCCDYCGENVAAVKSDGVVMYFPGGDGVESEGEKNEIHLPNWCPRTTTTTGIVCIKCCEEKNVTPF